MVRLVRHGSLEPAMRTPARSLLLALGSAVLGALGVGLGGVLARDSRHLLPEPMKLQASVGLGLAGLGAWVLVAVFRSWAAPRRPGVLPTDDTGRAVGSLVGFMVGGVGGLLAMVMALAGMPLGLPLMVALPVVGIVIAASAWVRYWPVMQYWPVMMVLLAVAMLALLAR